jgi:hypothetical protein
MEYPKRQNNKLIFTSILLLILINTAAGQNKNQTGYLFGNVLFAPARQGDYGTPAAGIIFEIRRKNKVTKVATNEAGLIDEKLPVGNYLLVSAKTAEGTLLSFKSNQYKCFQIKSNKTERFDIVVLKPGN